MDKRLQKYSQTSDALHYMSTCNLTKLILSNVIGQGYGVNSVIMINRTKIFIKAIPITKTDLNNMYDTSNIHNLPMYYNYGVGSAGFGCWRELAFHIKASNFVINDLCPNFPILYHYRIVENKQIAAKYKKYKFDKEFFEYWGSNKNIDIYLKARSETNYFIILCLEYFPTTMYSSNIIDKNTAWYINQISTIITFLKKHEVIHFDAHLGNLITNGKILILTDFGLVLDKSFRLTKPEIAFFNKNTNYDKATLITNISRGIFNHVLKSDNTPKYEKKYNFDKNTENEKLNNIVFDNIDDIGKAFNDNYIQTLKKYRSIIIKYKAFIYKLRRDNTKSVVFPNEK